MTRHLLITYRACACVYLLIYNRKSYLCTVYTLINWTPKHKNMFTEFWWWLKWGLSYSSQKFYFAPSILYSSQCSPFHIQNERRIAHAVIDWALYNARFRIWKRPVQNTFEKQNSAWIPLPPSARALLLTIQIFVFKTLIKRFYIW